MARLFLYSPATNECSRTGVCRRKFPVFTSSGIFCFERSWKRTDVQLPKEHTFFYVLNIGSANTYSECMFFFRLISSANVCSFRRSYPRGEEHTFCTYVLFLVNNAKRCSCHILVIAAGRSPQGGRQEFRFFLPLPIFGNGKHFHMNFQKIPTIQFFELSDNSKSSQLPITGSRGEFSEFSDNSKN